MRLIFLGTPTFAVPTLERIVEAGHEVLTVVTQPSRPRGRGQHPAAPPVAEAAAKLGLERPWEPTLAAARSEAVLPMAHRN